MARNRERNPAGETIRFEGVREPLAKYWNGKLAIYFCNYCQKAPTVRPNQIAVGVGHDSCIATASQRATKFFTELHDEQARKFAALANDILLLDPNADPFKDQ